MILTDNLKNIEGNMSFKTSQEEFWAGEFGNEYIARNNDVRLVAGNLNLFGKVLARTRGIHSVIEFGANIGNNLQAIKALLPKSELSAIEINEEAVKVLKKKEFNVYHTSLLEFTPDYQRDLVVIKTVLIHINPDYLSEAYKKLYDTSSKYLFIAEYYNPTPVAIPYRGHNDKLFKRDFAGEIMDKYSDVMLLDYGFMYRRDNNFLSDDINWFLLEKC